jgi:hypothetical protein
MRIGNEIRAYTIEPLEDPVPREAQRAPDTDEEREPAETPLLDRQHAPPIAVP